MKGYDYDRLSNLYMWVRRRLCHYGCSLCSRCSEEAMVFLMFTCIRGPGSSRRALAGCCILRRAAMLEYGAYDTISAYSYAQGA